MLSFLAGAAVAAGMGEQDRLLVRLRDRRTPIRVVLDAEDDILL